MSEKIKCVKFDMYGNCSPYITELCRGSLTTLVLNMFGELPEHCLEVGDKYTLEVVEMDREEYKNLPEWDGF